MELSEYPLVEGGDSRALFFPKIKWLTKTKFEELLNKNKPIYPCLEFESKSNKKKESRIFVGKTIPKLPETIVDTDLLNMTEPHSHLNLELVGNVVKFDDGKWILIITFRGYVYEIEDDFLVLSIKDSNSFYWASNIDDKSNSPRFEFNNKDISKYALKAGVDRSENKFIYIGRSLKESQFNQRPKYYSNSWFYIYDSKMPQVFGKINPTYKLLFTPCKDLEIGHDQFETLCLKASPASLKMLCRSAVRSSMNYSQKNIKSMRKNLPESLVNFLKYPSSLKSGEYMLSDEKLVHESGQYEVFIDRETGDLCILNHENEIENRKILASNIDLIYLNRFNAVFYNHEKKRAIAHRSIYDNINGCVFSIDSNNLLISQF
jgi:hypothetical protein